MVVSNILAMHEREQRYRAIVVYLRVAIDFQARVIALLVDVSCECLLG
jgi:hypothetical protein